MGDIKLWQIFVALGVPGLALGVFYMLFRSFKWDFPRVKQVWVGPIVVLFMVLTTAVVLTGLLLWSPRGSSDGAEDRQAPSDDVADKLDKEIAHRLRDIPDTIRRSRKATNSIAKANLLSTIFAIPEADWVAPLFPEFAQRSIVSLCYDLKSASRAKDRETVEAARRVFHEWAKASRERYYVHDMYNMSVDRLKLAEDEAEG